MLDPTAGYRASPRPLWTPQHNQNTTAEGYGIYSLFPESAFTIPRHASSPFHALLNPHKAEPINFNTNTLHAGHASASGISSVISSGPAPPPAHTAILQHSLPANTVSTTIQKSNSRAIKSSSSTSIVANNLSTHRRGLEGSASPQLKIDNTAARANSCPRNSAISGLNANIPVGIAVARQRSSQEHGSHTTRHRNDTPIFQAPLSTATPPIIVGCDDRSLWPAPTATATTHSNLQHWQYSIGEAQPQPQSVPPFGFQLARDPVTGHFLLIPTTNLGLVVPCGDKNTPPLNLSSHIAAPPSPQNSGLALIQQLSALNNPTQFSSGSFFIQHISNTNTMQQPSVLISTQSLNSQTPPAPIQPAGSVMINHLPHLSPQVLGHLSSSADANTTYITTPTGLVINQQATSTTVQQSSPLIPVIQPQPPLTPVLPKPEKVESVVATDLSFHHTSNRHESSSVSVSSVERNVAVSLLPSSRQRSQGTSPVHCMNDNITPNMDTEDENEHQMLDTSAAVQDASNQTDTPSGSDDETANQTAQPDTIPDSIVRDVPLLEEKSVVIPKLEVLSKSDVLPKEPLNEEIESKVHSDVYIAKQTTEVSDGETESKISLDVSIAKLTTKTSIDEIETKTPLDDPFSQSTSKMKDTYVSITKSTMKTSITMETVLQLPVSDKQKPLSDTLEQVPNEETKLIDVSSLTGLELLNYGIEQLHSVVPDKTVNKEMEIQKPIKVEDSANVVITDLSERTETEPVVEKNLNEGSVPVVKTEDENPIIPVEIPALVDAQLDKANLNKPVKSEFSNMHSPIPQKDNEPVVNNLNQTSGAIDFDNNSSNDSSQSKDSANGLQFLLKAIESIEEVPDEQNKKEPSPLDKLPSTNETDQNCKVNTVKVASQESGPRLSHFYKSTESEKQAKKFLASKQEPEPQRTLSPFKSDEEASMRNKLNNIKREYRIVQKEFEKLSASCKSSSSQSDTTEVIKRKPGRPRKIFDDSLANAESKPKKTESKEKSSGRVKSVSPKRQVVDSDLLPPVLEPSWSALPQCNESRVPPILTPNDERAIPNFKIEGTSLKSNLKKRTKSERKVNDDDDEEYFPGKDIGISVYKKVSKSKKHNDDSHSRLHRKDSCASNSDLQQDLDFESYPPPLSPAESLSSDKTNREMSSKKRKVGRPRKCLVKPEPTETIVAKKARSSNINYLLNGSSSSGNRPSDDSPPAPTAHKIRPQLKAELKLKSWCSDDDDEDINWDPMLSNTRPKSPEHEIDSSTNKTYKKVKLLKKRRTSLPESNEWTPFVSNSSKINTTADKLKKRKSLLLTSSDQSSEKTKSKPGKKSKNRTQSNSSSSSMSSSSSSSSSYPNPHRPPPNIIVPIGTSIQMLTADALSASKFPLRVLFYTGEYFNAGTMYAVTAPDIYGIHLDGERANHQNIHTQEEVLKDTIIEVRPDKVPEPGDRICGYWSSTSKNIFPGIVLSVFKRATSPRSNGNTTTFLTVDFDDGDFNTIPFEDARLLPSNYPLKPGRLKQEQSKRKRRSSSNSSENNKTSPVSIKIIKLEDEERLHAQVSLKNEGEDFYETKKSCSVERDLPKTKIIIKNNKTMGRFESQLSEEVIKEDVKNDVFVGKGEISVVDEAIDRGDNPEDRDKNFDESKQITDGVIENDSKIVEGDDESVLPQRNVLSLKISDIDLRDVRREKKKRKKSSRSDNEDSVEGVKKHKQKHKHHDCEKPHRHKHKHKHKKHRHKHEELSEESVSPETSDIKIEDEKIEDENNKEEKHVEEIPVTEDEPMDEDIKPEENDSYDQEENPDLDNLKKRKRVPSSEGRSQMAAFLPERQLWNWSGRGFKKPGAKGRGRKLFFRSIFRECETISVGDCAVFLSTGRPDRPYIGRIESMWTNSTQNMLVRVKWFYHPEETVGCPELTLPGALFESPHIDENDVQTISHKCEVIDIKNYQKWLAEDPQRVDHVYDLNDVYYLAGHYDPVARSIKFQPDIV